MISVTAYEKRKFQSTPINKMRLLEDCPVKTEIIYANQQLNRGAAFPPYPKEFDHHGVM